MKGVFTDNIKEADEVEIQEAYEVEIQGQKVVTTRKSAHILGIPFSTDTNDNNIDTHDSNVVDLSGSSFEIQGQKVVTTRKSAHILGIPLSTDTNDNNVDTHDSNVVDLSGSSSPSVCCIIL